MIPQHRLDEFCALYRSVFGVDITPHKALPMAIRLVGLFRAVYGPDTGVDEDGEAANSTA